MLLNCRMKAYALVAFLGENSVSTMPRCWFLPGAILCLWPGNTSQAEVSDLIRKAALPEKGFGAHTKRLLKMCSKLPCHSSYSCSRSLESSGDGKINCN